MKTLFSKTKRLFNQILGFFPSPIPVGMTEFQVWVDSFISTYDLPTKDRDSVAYTLSTMILHSGPTVAYKSKFSFLLALRAGAAKQVAGATFHEIKTRHDAARKAALATEATDTAAAVASNEPQGV